MRRQHVSQDARNAGIGLNDIVIPKGMQWPVDHGVSTPIDIDIQAGLIREVVLGESFDVTVPIKQLP